MKDALVTRPEGRLPPWNKGLKGAQGYWKGKHRSEETKRKISEAHKGLHPSPETRKKMSETHKGIITDEIRQKVSKAKKGQIPWNKDKHHSDETRRKLSKALKGNKNPLGYHPSDETIRKMRESHIGHYHSEESKRKMSGEKNHNWQGGTSFEPYTQEWTRRLREKIRERDNYTCQLCGEPFCKCVHHIDYDKNNCKESNLITLCYRCHNTTNARREFWQERLEAKMAFVLMKERGEIV